MAERARDSDEAQIGPELQGMHDPGQLSALLRRAGWRLAGYDPGVYLRFEPPPGLSARAFSLLVPLNPAAPEFGDTMQHTIDVLSAYMCLGAALTAAAEWMEHAEDRDQNGDHSHSAGHDAVYAPVVTIRPVRYEATCLPEDHRYRQLTTLYLERDSQSGWCVTDGLDPPLYVSRDGTWSSPFDTTTRHSTRRSFPLEEAHALVEKHLPYLNFGCGKTAAALLLAEEDLSDVAYEALRRNLSTGPRQRDTEAKTGSSTAFSPAAYGTGRDSPGSGER